MRIADYSELRIPDYSELSEMRIDSHNILRWIFLTILTVGMLGSCSDGFGSGWGTADDEAEVKIQLYTKTSDALTRATLGETDASPHELIKSWRVVFVDKNNIVAKIASSTLADPVSMDIINTVLPAGHYTAYAFANITEDYLKERTGISFTEGERVESDVVENAIIGLSNGTIKKASGLEYIPMAGKLEITAKGGVNEPYAIEVVRLLGKVEFAFANMIEAPVKVKSIGFGLLHEGPVRLLPDYDKLATPNEEGSAPEIVDGSEVAGDIDDTTGLRYFKHDLGDNAPEVTKAETAGISDSEFKRDEQFTFYVRETAIPGKSGDDDATSDCCWFRLEVEHGGMTRTVYAKVKDLTFINRNDHILIPVRLRLSTDHELTVDVLPYRSVVLKPDFGLKLGALNLNTQVIRLYTDDNVDTKSSATVRALDEDGNPITQGVTWALDNNTDDRVCDYNANEDGTCTVTARQGKRGRDVLTATIIKNGLEITDECVVEVSDRHLSLNKTFLGLTPQNEGVKHHEGEFQLDIVAETDDKGLLWWKILDVNGNEKNLDITVSVSNEHGEITNGSVFTDNHANVTVKSGVITETAYLWFYYEGPDPHDTGKRKEYSSYCEIMVQNIGLTCDPRKTTVIKGQTTTFNTTIIPKFSDLIPSVKYISDNPSVATVDENGVVTGVMPGVAKIEAYNDTDFAPLKVSDIVEVTVVPNNLVLMREDGTTNADEIEILSTEKVRCKAMSDGKDISSKVTWTVVEKDKFVKVTGGELTGAAATSNGTNTVLATYDYTDKDGKTTTLSARCVVVVSSVRKLIIDEHAHGISINGEIPLKAHVFPDSRPYDQRQQSITWSSADESIISIKDNVYAEAKAYGKTTITATTTYGGKTLTASMEMEVMKEKEPGTDPEPDFDPNLLQLFIYNSKGELVSEITSEDQETDNTNVFQWVRMPKGDTWTAKVILDEDPNIVITNAEWTDFKRHDSHYNYIEIPGNNHGNTCTIHARTDEEVNRNPNQSTQWHFKEIIFKWKSKTKEYSRRFSVYVE